jgi:hypothetical protein
MIWITPANIQALAAWLIQVSYQGREMGYQQDLCARQAHDEVTPLEAERST